MELAPHTPCTFHQAQCYQGWHSINLTSSQNVKLDSCASIGNGVGSILQMFAPSRMWPAAPAKSSRSWQEDLHHVAGSWPDSHFVGSRGLAGTLQRGDVLLLIPPHWDGPSICSRDLVKGTCRITWIIYTRVFDPFDRQMPSRHSQGQYCVDNITPCPLGCG